MSNFGIARGPGIVPTHSPWPPWFQCLELWFHELNALRQEAWGSLKHRRSWIRFCGQARVSLNLSLTRRSVFRGAAAPFAIAGMPAPRNGRAQKATPAVSTGASPVAGTSLWQAAWQNGIVFGTSLATWQIEDEYIPVVEREAALLFTEDDLLWWRLKPTPESSLDFTTADQFMDLAESHGSLVVGAHLVWDEGFGEGWTDEDLRGLEAEAARTLIMGVIEETVGRYKGRVSARIVANEVIDANEANGLRIDVPWYQTIGPTYVQEAFVKAREVDPDALLILNEFGFERLDRIPASEQVVDDEKCVCALVRRGIEFAVGSKPNSFRINSASDRPRALSRTLPERRSARSSGTRHIDAQTVCLVRIDHFVGDNPAGDSPLVPTNRFLNDAHDQSPRGFRLQPPKVLVRPTFAEAFVPNEMRTDDE